MALFFFDNVYEVYQNRTVSVRKRTLLEDANMHISFLINVLKVWHEICKKYCII